jgi:signal transduction histidine kinase/DNA-binding response OmpR family regulator
MKQVDERIKNIMDVLLEYVTMDFSRKIELSDKGDEIDAISLALNTLGVELEGKSKLVQQNQHRVNMVMDVLLKYTMMDFSEKLPISDEGDEWDAVALGLNTLAEELDTSMQIARKRREEMEMLTQTLSKQNKVLNGIDSLNKILRGDKSIKQLSQDIVNDICGTLKAAIGVIYLVETENVLTLQAGYAFDEPEKKKTIAFGQGIIGQAALEKKSRALTNLPSSYLKISSGLVEMIPANVYVFPFMFKGEVIGVLELGLMDELNDDDQQFIDIITSDQLGITFNTAISRLFTDKLLKQTQLQSEELQHQAEELQVQAEELQNQQEELLQTNFALTNQTEELSISEEELRIQQEGLQLTNTKLEEQTLILNEKNKFLEEARLTIALKVEELERTNKYKSDFLANMSHELRTPLNSILILANILKENKKANLSSEQVEFAEIINKSGTDLLEIINDILDLSKIESGKMELELNKESINSITKDIYNTFFEQAKRKGLDFSIVLENDLPEHIYIDKQKIAQILKNLLSNALKFTPKGKSVSLRIFKTNNKGAFFTNHKLIEASTIIGFSVNDQGIGISEEKQKLVFEAFQQADTSTSRKYGGTGLGLSISSALSQILGGEISLVSKLGMGSNFTLYIPANTLPENDLITTHENEIPLINAAANSINLIDERDTIGHEDKVVLIIEDNRSFCQIIQKFAYELGFKTIIAIQGDTGFAYAKEFLPDAIILDIQLPLIDGMKVLEQLKANFNTKNIPVHIISVMDDKMKSFKMGAKSHDVKPITGETITHLFETISNGISISKLRVLIIEEDPIHMKHLCSNLVLRKVVFCSSTNFNDALVLMNNESFDSIIINPLQGGSLALNFLKRIKELAQNSNLQVIAYVDAVIAETYKNVLKEYTNHIVIKPNLLSIVDIENGIDEFLSILKRDKEQRTLTGKKVLLVDDEPINIYVLKKLLDDYKMNIVTANDGKQALEKLYAESDFDIVLMDMMMPEMNGYEAITEIRKRPYYQNIPVIALTANAMKGDFEKVMEAGATDYVSKPINSKLLLTTMNKWI